MIINTAKANLVPLKSSQTLSKKEETGEPADGFTPSAPEEKLGYGKNLMKSTAAGALKGFFKVSEFVDEKLPSYDGLDHFGMHVLMAGIAMGCGAIGGVIPGAIYGFAKGLAGGTVDLSDIR